MLHLALKAFGRRRCRSACCTWTPGTTSPRSWSTGTAPPTQHGLRLQVASVQDYIDDGRLRERPDGTRNPLQTVAAAGRHRRAPRSTPCSAAAAATRRRPAPRSGSSPCATSSGSGIPAASAPSCGRSTTASTGPASTCGCSRCPTGPSSTSGSTSSRRTSSCPSIYFAHQREVFQRNGMWLAARRVGRPAGRRARRAPHGALPHRRRHVLHRRRRVRRARTVAEVIAEIAASALTERGATRADDRLSEAAMEDRKREGYF